MIEEIIIPTPTPIFNFVESIGQSIVFVSRVQGFLLMMSLVICFGMFVGIKLDDGRAGFNRSALVLLPYIALVMTINISRIYQTMLLMPITYSAFNGIATLLITSIFYLLGLCIGHMIFKKAKKDAGIK